MGTLLPYRCARMLLAEFLPLVHIPAVETTRQRTLRVGARLEREAAVQPPLQPPRRRRSHCPSTVVTCGRFADTRCVRSRFFVAQVRNDDGQQIVFSSMPAEADRQREQLRGVLHGLGATPTTPITILSDGAEGPQFLGEAASCGPTHHVLDWFHLSMRVQHVAEMAKGWPDASAGDRQLGALPCRYDRADPLASLAWPGQAGSGSHWRKLW